MCDLDGLTTMSDCFSVGFSYGLDGTSLGAMWVSLAANGAADLDDWQRDSLSEGWHAGRADWEAFNAVPVVDAVPLADVGDDEFPW